MQAPTIRGGNYATMPDEELVRQAHFDISEATEWLIARYRPFVEVKARSFFVVGADRDDVIQEGLIGLYKAIRDYRDTPTNRFRPFAELCVTRHIISAVKSAARQKHAPLNSSLSLNHPSVHFAAVGPEADFSNQWLQEVRESMSALEREVLVGFLEGRSYQELSGRLGCGTKAVDNALQRIKRKISSALLQSKCPLG